MIRRLFALTAVFLASQALAAVDCSTRKYYECYEYEEEVTVGWKEDSVALPAAPVADQLIPFEVDVSNANRFFVDPASINIGKDGVVRFTVVIESSEGARTVNFEGIRCETRERKIYAFGQADGTWVKSQGASWIPMLKQQHKLHNAYYAVLANEYLCVHKKPIETSEAAIERLRYGSAAVSGR